MIALIVSFAFFMQQLDGTVIATALPQMARTFGETPVDVSIGMTAYLLTLAVFIPSSSWFADRFGSKTIFGGAIVVFTLGSILCGLSNTLPAFVGARIVQAIGGAMMLPVGRLVVLRVAQKHELLRTMQYITIPGLVAPVIGPPLGGFIVTFTSTWRWIFFLNIPIGIIGLLLTCAFMTNITSSERRPFDVRGFVFSGAGLAALMYGFTLLGHPDGRWPTTAAFLLGGALLVALALRHGHRHTAPLVDLGALHVPTFVLTTVSAGWFYRMIIGATPFLWPLLFQVGFGDSAFVSGLLVMAMTSGDLGAQTFVRALLRRFGYRVVMLAAGSGTTLLVIACMFFTRTTPALVIVAVLVIFGIFRSLQYTAMNTLAYSDITPATMSSASTLASTVQQLAVGTGVAFAAFALNTIAAVHGDAARGLTLADIQLAFAAVAVLGVISTLWFRRLPATAGAQMMQAPARAR